MIMIRTTTEGYVHNANFSLHIYFCSSHLRSLIHRTRSAHKDLSPIHWEYQNILHLVSELVQDLVNSAYGSGLPNADSKGNAMRHQPVTGSHPRQRAHWWQVTSFPGCAWRRTSGRWLHIYFIYGAVLYKGKGKEKSNTT